METLTPEQEAQIAIIVEKWRAIAPGSSRLITNSDSTQKARPQFNWLMAIACMPTTVLPYPKHMENCTRTSGKLNGF